jgi:nucleoside-diphosphate-sugar epimerase
MVLGKYRTELPPSGVYLWVDVRDLALAHVRGIEVPEAGGERFFVTAGHYSNKSIVEAIRETHPELDGHLAPKDSSDDLPKNVYGFDNSKVVTILGLKFRTLNETVSETVQSLQTAGVGDNL